jgi:hypothetical protein
MIDFDEKSEITNISSFEGRFYKGKPCGKGTLNYKSGHVIEGMFTNKSQCVENINEKEEMEFFFTFESDLLPPSSKLFYKKGKKVFFNKKNCLTNRK